MHEKRTIVIDGRTYEISVPPTESDWEILDAYLRNLSAFNHRLLKAVVALEKKVHWGVPTSPHLRRRACDCPKEEEPEGYDPLADDEGDTDHTGPGSGPGTWGT